MQYFYSGFAFILAFASIATVAFAEEGSGDSMRSIGTIAIVIGLVCLACGLAMGARRQVQSLLGSNRVKAREADEHLSPFR